MPRPTPSIIAVLERSRLLSATQWSELRREGVLERLSRNGSPRDDEAARFLDDLVGRQWLTPWQAEMLRLGRSGFILGQYRLLECIGIGGNGHVFRAEHRTLGRTAAIKVLAPALMKDRHSLARFHQEIQAAAALDHPHIVRAYDAGAAGDLHFLVMEYVEGRNLGELSDARGPLPIGWTCECLRQAALALQHAHERGMIHRDVKPSNLLVWRNPETGRPVAKVLDLGLARFVSELLPDGGLTHSGQVLGTPDYIAPEQAADTRSADIRSDIFSLGCTLFRLLTGSVPFSGGNVMEKLMSRATTDAPPVRQLRAEVPAELEAVLSRMLDRNPERRYQTPGEVAAALAPFARLPSEDPLRAGQPARRLRAAAPGHDADSDLGQFLRQIAEEMDNDATVDIATAQRPGIPDDAQPAKANRRRRRLGLLIGGACLLLAAAAWGGSLLWGRPAVATLVVDWPERERADARFLVNGEAVPLTGSSPLLVTRSAGRLKLRAERRGYRPIDLTLDLSSNQRHPWKPAWTPTAASLRRRSVADLQERVASAKKDPGGPIDALRSQCLEFVRTNRGTAESLLAVQALARLPCPLDRFDRSQVLRPELRNAGQLDPAPLELVGVLGDSRLRHWNEALRVAVHPDGSLIASVGREGTVCVWEASTGNLRHKWFVGEGDCQIGFSPRGDALATGLPEREVSLWDLATGQQRAMLSGSRPPFALTSDGSTVVADAGERGLGLWNAADGAPRGALPRLTAPLVQLLPSPQAGILAAEYSDHRLAVLDLATREVRFLLQNTRRSIFDAAGTLIAAERTEETFRNDTGVWDAATGTLQKTLDEAGSPLAFGSDGRTLFTVRTGRVISWDAAAGTERQTIRDVPELLQASPDRQWLVAADGEFGAVQFWNLLTGHSSRADGHLSGIADVAFTSDSRMAVTASRDHSLKLWVVAEGVERFLAGRGIGPVDVSPDGRTLVLASDEGSLKLWDITTGKASRTLVDQAKTVRRVAFSPNGRLVACVGDWGFFQFTLRLFEAGSGAEVSLPGDPLGTVRAFEFHPDGQRLAVAFGGRGVTVFDLQRRRIDAQIEDETGEVRSLAFSPDGTRLAVSRAGKGVSIWKLGDSMNRVTLGGLGSDVVALAYSPDGRHLAGATPHGDAGVWDAATSRLVQKLSVPGRKATALAYAPDGKTLALCNNSGQLHLWTLDGTSGDGRTADSSPRPPSRTLTLGPVGGIVRHLVFSPEGRHILTANGNGTVYVLRLAGL